MTPIVLTSSSETTVLSVSIGTYQRAATEGGPWWSGTRCAGTTQLSESSSGERSQRATRKRSRCLRASRTPRHICSSTGAGASWGRALWRRSLGWARRPKRRTREVNSEQRAAPPEAKVFPGGLFDLLPSSPTSAEGGHEAAVTRAQHDQVRIAFQVVTSRQPHLHPRTPYPCLPSREPDENSLTFGRHRLKPSVREVKRVVMNSQ